MPPRRQALVAPELVAQMVKRDMGTGAEYMFHGERHTPETVSALILRELARTRPEQTGSQFRDVVITIPAYFGIAEREATRRAGQFAGLNVLDVLAEPVAAALHYRSLAATPAARPAHILVYDLGGGTFDTTVIRLDGDDVTVVCTDGDAPAWAAPTGTRPSPLPARPGSKRLTRAAHPERRPAFMQDLLISAEQLKKELSTPRSGGTSCASAAASPRWNSPGPRSRT